MKLIRYYNQTTGADGVMAGPSLFEAVIQAYAKHDPHGNPYTPDMASTYGHLVTSVDDQKAVLGDWVAEWLPTGND